MSGIPSTSGQVLVYAASALCRKHALLDEDLCNPQAMLTFYTIGAHAHEDDGASSQLAHDLKDDTHCNINCIAIQ